MLCRRCGTLDRAVWPAPHAEVKRQTHTATRAVTERAVGLVRRAPGAGWIKRFTQVAIEGEVSSADWAVARLAVSDPRREALSLGPVRLAGIRGLRAAAATLGTRRARGHDS